MRGRGLDTGLRGELHLTSPGGRLAVNGTVRTVDGTYAGLRPEARRSTAACSPSAGPVDNPRLDIEATRPNLDVRVGVAVSGTALMPRVRLFSEPEMSEIDKLSWLVLGRASETAWAAPTPRCCSAPRWRCSPAKAAGATDQLIKAIGLDDLSVRQSEGEVREDTWSRSASSCRGAGTSATSAASTRPTGNWQLIYRIARRFTLRAQSGEDNSLDRDLDLALAVRVARGLRPRPNRPWRCGSA